MRSTLLAAGLTGGLCLAALAPLRSQPETKSQTAPPAGARPASTAAPSAARGAPSNGREADEAAIHAAAEAFGTAYNTHDAPAIAALFAPEAKIVTEDGQTVDGREAIESVFAELFDDEPVTEIELAIASITFIGNELAVEAGSTKTVPAPGETPEYSRYTALHVKRDGQWLMAAVRDTEGEPPTNHERLQPLAWLVGEWVDESPDSRVLTSCHWSDDGNFLLQDVHVQIAGHTAMEVTQRIGWDPLSKRIRSWVFDSEGGFGEGVWARDGDAWIIKATFVRADGMPATATNLFIPAGRDSYVWRSTDRIVGDEVQPELEVSIVRRPPAPQETTN